ncbi:hypothetical protein KUV62_16325 [Salipiger bermudensis]|uniref:hypothetical protein n=1 Tax=Salipiger bermudensis TaxID=344736 RepID=UPI001C9972A1|nr:hypothetical protein [Salipiger bermudensis]MBY6005493.1 hypothetical protein [Salipiger bermudensis]
MKKSLTVLIVAGVVLAGCSSSWNPVNWFGQSETVPTTIDTSATGASNPLIPARRASIFRSDAAELYLGSRIETISELLIERRPGGAIIRVTGTANRAGPFEVRLLPDEAETDGDTLAYTMNALQSAGPVNVDADARSVTAAIWLTDQELFGIREIRVAGRSNVLVSRR